jgi:glycosyltransferase involved in cell wall biosynthesis
MPSVHTLIYPDHDRTTPDGTITASSADFAGGAHQDSCGADLQRALWVCDYFPRPHEATTGTWALESTVALQAAGLPVVVLAPTPWIPGPLAITPELRRWSEVPAKQRIKGVPVHYPRVPHYPRRWVRERIYDHVPTLEADLLWPWFRHAADRVMERTPFDVVHANFLFPGGHLGMMLKRRYGVPLIVHERSVQRLATARDNPQRGVAYRRILRAADAVITENHKMADELRALEPAIRRLEIYRQPGTHWDTASELRRRFPPFRSDRLTVLSVGALSERKGHEYLVRAIAELVPHFPTLQCRIIGDGAERPKLEALIRALQLTGTVELCGRRPHDEVLAEMARCDVFALPSWGEAGGTVYAEAMQFGKPVVVCEGEGITDVVQHDVHGLLVPARDANDLAQALHRLLADASARDRMGNAARELVAVEFSYPKLAARLIALYRDLRTAAGPRHGSRPAIGPLLRYG